MGGEAVGHAAWARQLLRNRLANYDAIIMGAGGSL